MADPISLNTGNFLEHPDHILPHMVHAVNKTEELDEDSHETLSDEILIVISLLVLASWLSAVARNWTWITVRQKP